MWESGLGLGPFASGTEDIRVKMEVTPKPTEEFEEEDTEGVDLYKDSFSLAYGTLTLLRDTKMHLKRNRFWVCGGRTGCGKVTLMRAVANEQLEGFPKHDELKSVFVGIEDEEVSVQHMQETLMKYIMWRFWVTTAVVEEFARRWSASTVLPEATFLY